MSFQIVHEGHPALRRRSFEVGIPLRMEEVALMHEMLRYVQNSSHCVGLAAPQLAINKRIMVVGNYVLANPRITFLTSESTFYPNGESCLSVPGKRGQVNRCKEVVLSGFTPEGNYVNLRLSDNMAVIAQHELDHLNGILFTDYL